MKRFISFCIITMITSFVLLVISSCNTFEHLGSYEYPYEACEKNALCHNGSSGGDIAVNAGNESKSELELTFTKIELSGILVPAVWVSGMNNYELEARVNNSIKEAVTHWIKGQALHLIPQHTDVVFLSDRYLSFYNTFGSESSRADMFHDFITIDMQTGYRVMLDDLVYINEEFIKKVLEVGYFYPWGSWWQHLNDNLLMRLFEASLNQLEVFDDAFYNIKESLGAILFRSVFTLREGQIVIIQLQPGGLDPLTCFSRLEISIEDIEDFLRVRKW